nr:esterase FE4-like [Onthophagus taurus]
MFALLLTINIFKIVFAIEPIVKIEDGELRGSILKDIDGKPFYSFQKIPFAAPPIRSLRFKDPKPNQKWKGVRDATKESPICLQKQFLLHGNFTGVEDCLYLNVYTPKIKPNKLFPVLVFIHGGGFIEGSGTYSFYGPEFLISQNIILVTINYRLGILGFLNFKNQSLNVPGNAGLKDQTMALKWVRKNIEQFGGDKNKVTIVGQSAGAASVHLHVISPLSKGLFSNAIIQSGTSLAPWCNGEINNGVTAANILNYQGNNESDMLKLLQNASVDELKKASVNVSMLVEIDKPNRFGPTIEHPNREAFLTDNPRKLIKKGLFNHDVKIMIGITSAEGMVMDSFFIYRDGIFNPLPTSKFIPYYFKFSSDKNRQKLVNKINKFYNLENKLDPNPHLNLQSDSYFTFCLYETIFGHLRYNQIYLYLFSSDSKLNMWKYSNNVTKNYEGVCHIDDLGYLFPNPNTPKVAYDKTSKEYRYIKNTVKLISNFVKFETPTLPDERIQWKKVNNKSINYYNINLDNNTRGIGFYKERVMFWCDVYREQKYPNFCPDNF